MFFVEARYHRDPSRVGAQVRYIAHREEGLTDGRRREIYGIGERYRALKGDEPAIEEASEHQSCRGAALQKGRNRETRGECPYSIAEREPEHVAE